MHPSPDLACKVRQLDNDVQQIYEMLAGISATQTRQRNRLEEIAGIQAEHTGTFAGHTAALAGHTATLSEHTAKLDRIIALLDNR